MLAYSEACTDMQRITLTTEEPPADSNCLTTALGLIWSNPAHSCGTMSVPLHVEPYLPRLRLRH